MGMPGHAFIGCRVTVEMKARVRSLAEREGVTESKLVKQLLDVVLRASGSEPSATVAQPHRGASAASANNTDLGRDDKPNPERALRL